MWPVTPMKQKVALITGLTGQDGSLLAKLLLARGYRVVGTVRRSASANLWRLEELGIHKHECLSLRSFELLDSEGARRLLNEVHPDEVYNFAGQSSVSAPFDEPLLTLQAVGAAPLQFLEAIRQCDPKIRFFQASSAEMFGMPRSAPQDEDTPLCPRTPYGAAKVYAHWMTVSYRDTYGLLACSAILYNHESSLRGREFVTRKITDSVAKIRLGKLDCLRLGRLDTRRDWGYAPDYVEAMHRMMRAEVPATYVLATGRTTSIREFAAIAFRAADIEIEFRGGGEDETAVDRKSGRTVIRVDRALYRPVEPEQLVGNPARARAALGWDPSMPLDRICTEMVEADLKRNAAGVSF
jgi:GDPmannose 4,6-dehydratase